MLFTSYSFLFLFLPLFLLAYVACPIRGRSALILVGSYVFYAFWRVDFCLLLLGVSLLGYGGGRLVDRWSSNRARWASAAFITSVATMLAGLAWFKYAGFLGESWNSLIRYIGAPGWTITVPEVLLPVGISFYTFQAISYVVDVARGQCSALCGLRPCDLVHARGLGAGY